MNSTNYFRRILPFPAVLGLTAMLAFPAAAAVKMWEENVVIPTYLAGDPEPNPMFYFGRASQGAEGRVYPYPLYDILTGRKQDKTYKMVYLENEYMRVGILPEIGGRLFEAVDKSNGYNFIYRQHVIKPALIGLIGAWMSGGIEWNIPHHHRASTFLPVQYHLEENPDGSKTIWVGELEVRHRMEWAVGYTLHPGKSYLECKLRIINRTPFAQTMLCFANVAVHANDQYQVIFPPQTQHVTFHHKTDFTSWPVATTRYNGVDFTRGVDVSWYSNHISANSMFAWNYQEDFFAGYDHGREAGIVSYADHHIVPGKKFWTWGNGPRGRMWDKILTDDDGPYIELMTGAYSDNQPDYSWLQPFETRAFEMYWYPFRDLGGIKNANLDAGVNLETTKDTVKAGFCVTSAHRSAVASLKLGNKILFEEKIAITPGKPYVKTVPLPAGADEHDLRASLVADGRELIAYSPVRLQQEPTPPAVTGPPAPSEIRTVEELYLAGLRIEQFFNASLEPEPYWEEALRRDPGDVRVNTVLAINYLKKARFADAEKLLRKALERDTAKYTTPKDAEPFYYLGMALKAQGRFDDAFDAFGKATWSAEWKGPANFAMAEIASRRGDLNAALDYADHALEANARNLRALGLKASLLRALGRKQGAIATLADAAERVNPLDVRVLAERWMLGDKKAGAELDRNLREHPNAGLEAATEYGNAGLWRDGTTLLTRLAEIAPDPARVSPLAYYYLAQFAERLNAPEQAAKYRQLAMQASPEYVFPFQWEAIHVLRRAIETNPRDARSPYYLGNLLFDWQPDEAVKLWEQSVALDPAFPIAHRNLAVAYSHQNANEPARAIAQLEQAVSGGGRKYADHFFELDLLYETAAVLPEKRLALMEQNQATVLGRDDATARLITLKIFAGKYDEAISLMENHTFNIWEGGARFNVTDSWTDAHLLRGRQRLAAARNREALADFEAALNYPANLNAEPRQGAAPRQSEISWWLGCAQEALGNTDNAKQCWTEASSAEAPRGGGRRGGGGGGGRRGGGGAGGFVADRNVQRYYQARAMQKLGQNDPAETIFRELAAVAGSMLAQGDSETPAGDGQPRRTRDASAHFAAGLGHLALGENDKAREEFQGALKAAPDHLGAKMELAALR